MICYYLVVIKPDAIDMVGNLLAQFQCRGHVLCAVDSRVLSRDVADDLYEEHRGASYHARNLDHITSGRSVICCFAGDVHIARCLLHHIRKGCENPRNRVHVSDSEISARRELALFWGDEFDHDVPQTFCTPQAPLELIRRTIDSRQVFAGLIDSTYEDAYQREDRVHRPRPPATIIDYVMPNDDVLLAKLREKGEAADALAERFGRLKKTSEYATAYGSLTAQPTFPRLYTQHPSTEGRMASADPAQHLTSVEFVQADAGYGSVHMDDGKIRISSAGHVSELHDFYNQILGESFDVGPGN